MSDSLPRFIEAMLEPAFYTHGTARSIRLVQTHISYVVLTGEFAYKVKKPVDLGFLDFSSLEKRKHLCHEEVRLNKLYAPDLYLDVEAIYESDGQFALTKIPGSRVIEYAVRMRQFRDEDLLLSIFLRGELTAELTRDLARHIARIHREAHTSENVAASGAPASVARVALQTVENLREHAGAVFDSDSVDRLGVFVRRALEAHRALFESRRAEGRFRECHGDLHLNNICLYRGRIELFDRIEFNEAFKNIDVVYDFAFLFMDLQFRGRRDLANVLMNVYLEQSGDYGGAALLPFYASCRAQIRAKVLAIQLDEPETLSESLPGILEDARKYIELALDYAERRVGSIILVMGLSGSGKSTVSAELAQRIDAIHIRSDAVRKHLAGVALTQTAPGLYSEEMTLKTYEALIDTGIDLASCGFRVILDATFTTRAQRARALSAARSRSLDTRLVMCRVDGEILRRRLEVREHDVSDADVTVLERQRAEFEEVTPSEYANPIDVDTAAGVDFAWLESEINAR